MSLLYTFYGDDFTGSTDVLEQLATHGLPAVLFLAPPTPAQLAAFPRARAIGVAGDSRSRSPEWMSANLPAAFTGLKNLNAPITHYKVCSTFDSSPTHGSIGRTLEIGLDVFSPRFVPIVVGAPHLRRYLAFGNLFAADPDGHILRIDRHPMARHPVTPMREADLRLHIAAQTPTKIGLIDLAVLNSGTAADRVESLLASDHRAMLFDTIDAQTQSAVGAFLWSEVQRQFTQKQSLFAIGSSGLTAALLSAWRTEGLLPGPPSLQPLLPAKPLLVVSGSCSEATRRQIEHALAHGFHGIRLDPAGLTPAGQSTCTAAYSAAFKTARASLADGRDTLLYTALGAVDPTPTGNTPNAHLGAPLGSLTRDLLTASASSPHPVRRLVLCGGDTASHATQQLGLFALTFANVLQFGVPLCRAHFDSALHAYPEGLELILKGGQVGSDNFFSFVRGA